MVINGETSIKTLTSSSTSRQTSFNAGNVRLSSGKDSSKFPKSQLNVGAVIANDEGGLTQIQAQNVVLTSRHNDATETPSQRN